MQKRKNFWKHLRHPKQEVMVASKNGIEVEYINHYNNEQANIESYKLNHLPIQRLIKQYSTETPKQKALEKNE